MFAPACLHLNFSLFVLHPSACCYTHCSTPCFFQLKYILKLVFEDFGVFAGSAHWGRVRWGAQLAGNAYVDYSDALWAFLAAAPRSPPRLAASCSGPREARGGKRGLRCRRRSAPLLHVRGTPPGPPCGNFPFFESPHCLSSETPLAGKQALGPCPVLLGRVGGGAIC